MKEAAHWTRNSSSAGFVNLGENICRALLARRTSNDRQAVLQSW
jgi:hypothetical protein